MTVEEELCLIFRVPPPLLWGHFQSQLDGEKPRLEIYEKQALRFIGLYDGREARRRLRRSRELKPRKYRHLLRRTHVQQ